MHVISPWVIGVALLILAAGIGVWLDIARRLVGGLGVVSFQPRRPVPWTAVELSLVLASYLLLRVVSVPVVFGLAGVEISSSAKDDSEPEELDPKRYTAMLLANVLGNVLAAAATLAILRSNGVALLHDTPSGRAVAGLQSRSAATWRDLGLSRPRWHDLTLGLAAFAAAVIPVYGLQALLAPFSDERHPIVEMLEQHMNFELLAVSVLCAVIVAPFVEELLFRVVLQGWLERVQMPAKATAVADPTAGTDGVSLDIQPTVREQFMPWPIVISSLAFALAHLGHGLDPIPLFFLALMLGYVYQRTHRLWPSLVVHLTLNSCSMWMLWLQTAGG